MIGRPWLLVLLAFGSLGSKCATIEEEKEPEPPPPDTPPAVRCTVDSCRASAGDRPVTDCRNVVGKQTCIYVCKDDDDCLKLAPHYTTCSGASDDNIRFCELEIDDTPDGGVATCEYVETLGTAKITALRPAPANGNNCQNNPVEVVFDFIPGSDAGVRTGNAGRRFTLPDGKNPPFSCIEWAGIELGAQVPALRADLKAGACAPTIFRLTSVDSSMCRSECGP